MTPTTTIKMGFDTIEINLVSSKFSVYNLFQRTVKHNRHNLHKKLQKYKNFTTRKRKKEKVASHNPPIL